MLRELCFCRTYGTKSYTLFSIGPLIFLSFHVAALQQRPAAAVVHLRHRLHLLQGNPRAGQDHRPHRRPRVHQHRRMHDGETDHEREREGETRGRGGGWLLIVGCVVVTYVVCRRVACRLMYVAPYKDMKTRHEERLFVLSRGASVGRRIYLHKH